MTKDEVLKLAQDACPYKSEELRGAFYEGFIKALDHVPDTTKMIEPDMGIDRGAWDDVPDATKWVDELRGDEPEREWVGLTDEEIAEGASQSWVDKQAFESAVWWAEEKLREKNGF